MNLYTRKYKLFIFGAIISLLHFKAFSIQCEPMYNGSQFNRLSARFSSAKHSELLQISCEYDNNNSYEFAPYYGKDAQNVWSYLYSYSGSPDGMYYMVCSGAIVGSSCSCWSDNPEKCKWEIVNCN